jgi:hypothetical protein
VDERSVSALVLSAIARSSGHLRALVETMDYLNRANPSADDFERAIRLLLGTGLIEEKKPMSFRLTELGRNTWKQTGGSGDIDRFVRLARTLNLAAPAPWTLDRSAYAAAEADYFETPDEH